jgi:tetratricopeptide (TPR) repeat protein
MEQDMDPKDPIALADLARSERRAGDLEAAATTQQLAIDAAGRQLADLYGILGGIQKDRGDLIAAARAYDVGFQLDERHHAPSSYNALNRLVTRTLLCPAAQSNPEALRAFPALAFVNVPEQLANLGQELRRQVDGPRAGDWWALGDLVVTAALNGEVDLTALAVDRLASASPPRWVFEAYGKTLEALARLDTPHRGICARAKALLDDRAPRA